MPSSFGKLLMSSTAKKHLFPPSSTKVPLPLQTEIKQTCSIDIEAWSHFRHSWNTQGSQEWSRSPILWRRIQGTYARKQDKASEDHSIVAPGECRGRKLYEATYEGSSLCTSWRKRLEESSLSISLELSCNTSQNHRSRSGRATLQSQNHNKPPWSCLHPREPLQWLQCASQGLSNKQKMKEHADKRAHA